MRKVLIDSDVILDFYFGREPFDKQAGQILALCDKQLIKGFLTPVMICNIYYILRKTNSHKSIIDRVTKLLTIIDVINIGRMEIEQALGSQFKDFEDAVQYYSAINHQSIEVIITRNLNDYKKSQVSVLTPKLFLKSLP